MKFLKTKEGLLLFGILFLSFFFRIYRLNELMPFFGDAARDYLAARDMTLKGVIPLLGSPSSVPWLHQGAFFTYLLGIVLWLGNYHPLWGGYFTAFLGVLNVYFVYRLGKKFFNKNAGLLAAFFYAASPLPVILDRFPYHQSLISILTVLFFLSLFLAVKKSIYFIGSSFLLGLLLQTELSNLVLAPILILLIIDFRKNISFRTLLLSLSAFLLTWISKIIYDISSGFTQTLGFAAWVVHKIFPFGPLADTGSLSPPFSVGIATLLDYISKIVFWPNVLVSTAILFFLIIFLFRGFDWSKRKKDIGRYLVLLWLVVPVAGFLIQRSPAGGYVPVFFALPALTLGGVLSNIKKFQKIFYVLIVFSVVFNGFLLINNDFFVLNGKNTKLKERYNMGQSVSLVGEMADFLVADSGSEPYFLFPLGSYAQFPAQKLDLVYLTWYLGSEPGESKKGIIYYIYGNDDQIDLNQGYFKKKFAYMTIVRKEND